MEATRLMLFVTVKSHENFSLGLNDEMNLRMFPGKVNLLCASFDVLLSAFDASHQNLEFLV